MALIGTLTSGVSALRTFSKGLEVIGNNIANVNTVGYKSSSATFEDSFSNTLRGSAPASATTSSQPGVQIGTGVQLGGIATNFGQGSFDNTGNVTDLGIAGNGFFIVKDAASSAQYATRDGQFRVDGNGYLVNQAGLRLQGLTGAGLGAVGDVRVGQSLPANSQLKSISIDSSGHLIEFYSNGASATTNQVQLQNFNDPSALMKQGGGLYSALANAGPVGGAVFATATTGGNVPGSNGLGSIQSGALEQSNVDLTQQFSDLITTQRSFQAGSRLVTVSDTILDDVVNLKRS